MKMTIACLSFLVLQMAGSPVQAGVPGFPGEPPFEVCTAEAGILINDLGECAEYTNGCEKNDLYDLGFREIAEGETCNVSILDGLDIKNDRSVLSGAE